MSFTNYKETPIRAEDYGFELESESDDDFVSGYDSDSGPQKEYTGWKSEITPRFGNEDSIPPKLVNMNINSGSYEFVIESYVRDENGYFTYPLKEADRFNNNTAAYTLTGVILLLIKKDKLEIFEDLIKHFALDYNLDDHFFLRKAIYHCAFDITGFLIELSTLDADSKSELLIKVCRRTALKAREPSHSDLLRMAKILINYGANPSYSIDFGVLFQKEKSYRKGFSNPELNFNEDSRNSYGSGGNPNNNTITALRGAIASQNIGLVSHLLELGVDPNAHNGMIAEVASFNSDVPMMKLLLKHKLNITSNSIPILRNAADRNGPIVHLLLDEGASIEGITYDDVKKVVMISDVGLLKKLVERGLDLTQMKPEKSSEKSNEMIAYLMASGMEFETICKLFIHERVGNWEEEVRKWGSGP